MPCFHNHVALGQSLDASGASPPGNPGTKGDLRKPKETRTGNSGLSATIVNKKHTVWSMWLRPSTHLHLKKQWLMFRLLSSLTLFLNDKGPQSLVSDHYLLNYVLNLLKPKPKPKWKSGSSGSDVTMTIRSCCPFRAWL